MKITQPMRGRRGAKRLDLTDMREIFKDRRMWSAIGVVTKPDDGEHFTETDEPKDITVEVILQPSLVPCTCRLSAAIWTLPDVGEEVAVLIPEGAADFMPLIVAVLSTNTLPTAQGPAVGRIAIVRGEVVVHDGNGGAVSLALKTEVAAVDSRLNAHLAAYNSHIHTGAFAGNTTPPTPLDASPPTTIIGTTVLKGK